MIDNIMFFFLFFFITATTVNDVEIELFKMVSDSEIDRVLIL